MATRKGSYKAGPMNRIVVPGTSGGTPRKQVGDAPSPVIQAQSAVVRGNGRPKKDRGTIKNNQRRRLLLTASGIEVTADDFLLTALGSPSVTDTNLLSVTSSATATAYGGVINHWFGSQDGPDTSLSDATKIYCEYEIVAFPGQTMGLGFIGSSELPGGTINASADSACVTMVLVWNSATVRINRGIAGNALVIANNSPGWVNGSVIGTAIDLDTGLCYMHIDGTWLTTATAGALGGEPGIGDGISITSWSPTNYNAFYAGMLTGNEAYDSGAAGVVSVRVGVSPQFCPDEYTPITVV